ncbi:MAG: metFprotein [Alphaproteobacteria bacterium]|nr:metFprotein [Alphaproteobacteria bacterium]
MSEKMTGKAPENSSEKATVDESAVRDFVRDFSIEVTPGAAKKIESFSEHIRPGCRVMITFLPGSDIEETRLLAERLRGEGYVAVPHFAARSFESRGQFVAFAEGLAKSGVNEAMVLAGAVKEPLGPFASSMDLLETGVFEANGFCRFGVAGHPEGSPDISAAALREAILWKNDWAARTGADAYLATQFCFEAAPVLEWERGIRADGNALEVRIGLPGPAQIKTLLMHAKNCGIGNSVRYLARQARNVSKLVTVNAPDKLVFGLVEGREAGNLISGVHLYPLGGFRRSAEWVYAVAAGDFTLTDGGLRVKARE